MKTLKKYKYILFLFILYSCNHEKNNSQYFNSLYFNSSKINSSYISGSYSEDSLHITYSIENANSMLLVYNNDSLIMDGNSIDITIRNLEARLSKIQTACKNYKEYANNWTDPINEFSSFHQVKIYAFNKTAIIDSLEANYILGIINKDNLPIVNLNVDENLFFSSDSGCYVPGNSFDKNNDQTTGNFYLFKQRKQIASIQIIDNNKQYLNGKFLCRIHGYITPLAPQKSLRFYLKENTKINKLLKLNHEVDKIILRSSYSGWGSEMFLDGWIADVCSNLNIDVMEYKGVKVYLNGEYWGIHGLREGLDLKAISSKYKIKKKKIIDADDKGFSKTEGYGDLNRLLLKIKSKPNYSYDSVIKYFNQSSLVDWLATELFFQNSDWPCNNTFFWKKRKQKSKWNCVLIDMDACVGNPKTNMFDFAIKDRAPKLGGVLVTYLLKQKAFQIVFKKRVDYLLLNDFSTQQLLNKLQYYEDLFNPAIKEHYDRWNSINGLDKYKKALNRINTFCKNRQYYFKQNMNEFFE